MEPCFTKYKGLHHPYAWCPRRSEDIGYTETGVTNGYELSHDCWKLSPGPLLLTTGLSLATVPEPLLIELSNNC